ncbi:MAG: helix-turn-helix transcriptional regulator [Flavobacteriaceae bacterium]
MRKIELNSIDTIEGILADFKSYFPSAELDDKGLRVATAEDQFIYSVQNFADLFHLVLFEGVLGQETEVLVKPNENKSIVMRFLMESSLTYREHEMSIGQGMDNGGSIFNSYTPQEFVLPAATRIKYLTIHIPLDNWRSFTEGKWTALNEIVENQAPWILFEGMTPQYSKLLKDICAYNQLDQGRKALCMARSLELATHFLIQLQKRGQDKENLGIPDVELSKILAIRETLSRNLENPPTMEILSREFGMSESKLRNNFKKVYGMPPYQFVLRERLQEAYRLLLSGSRPLMDIALSLGFNDQSHFNRAFKSAFDCTPSSLR